MLFQDVNVFILDDFAFEVDRNGQKRELVREINELYAAEPKLSRRVGKHVTFAEQFIYALPDGGKRGQ